MPGLGLNLACGDDDQEPPEVVAIGELGERPRASPARRLSKALRAASSSSLPVLVAGRPQPHPGQLDHAGEIPFPERLNGRTCRPASRSAIHRVTEP